MMACDVLFVHFWWFPFCTRQLRTIHNYKAEKKYTTRHAFDGENNAGN